MPWNRKTVADTAQEILEHVKLVDNVRALQQGQKEIADAIAKLNEKIRDLDVQMRILKSEIKLEAIKETQMMVNAVQGAFHEKLTDLTVRVTTAEHQRSATKASIMALADHHGSSKSDCDPPLK